MGEVYRTGSEGGEELGPRAPTAPVANTLPAPTQGFTLIQKLLIILTPFLLYGGYHWYQNTQASTTINQTISSNDDLENGLLIHYTFDGPDISWWAADSATATDKSGNGYNGAYSGLGPAQDVAAGRIGQALKFKSAYMTAGDVNAVDSLTAATFCSWMKHDSITSDDEIISKNSGVGGFKFFRDETTTGKRDVYSLFVADDTGSGGDIATVESAASSTPLGRWVHVCGSFVATNASGLKLYIDGVLVSTVATTFVDGFNAGTEELVVGLGFDGLLDDVRVYNRALSASEVKRLYELGATTHINTTIDENDDLNNGLVVHYTFDGSDMNIASGTREVLDTSGNGNHGNWIDHATTTVPGRIGQALYFNKTSSDREYIDGGSASGIDDIQDMTISAWIKVRPDNTMSGEPAIVSKISTCNGTNQGWKLYLLDSVGSGFPSFKRAFGSGSAQQGEWFAGQEVQYGGWQHVVMTYSYTSATNDPTFYIDGSLTSTSEGSTPVGSQRTDAAQTLTVGGCVAAGHSFEGDIDDVRIYNRILSASDVKRLYELGGTTHINTTIDTNDDLENGLVGHWTFDGPKMAWGSSTAEVLDSSTGGANGDMLNMTQSAATAGRLGQGLLFDGSTNYLRISHKSDLKSNSQSVGFWVFPSQLPSVGYDGIFSIFSGSDVDAFECFINNNSSTLSCGSWPWSYTYTLPSANTWYHVYFESVSGSGKLYVNGILVDSTGSVSYGGSSNTSAIEIGTRSFQGYYFPGKIDDVRLYNRTLSASEVKRLYELGGGR